ncbi:MAG: toxic anion resistance protein [Candidatus Competibacter sp.]|nr:toxic anion resistance protein [Candidatus Competibacter sp.]
MNEALTAMEGVTVQTISLDGGASLQAVEVKPPPPLHPPNEDEQLAAIKIDQYLPSLDQQVETKIARFQIADLHEDHFQQELRGIQSLGNEFLARMSNASSELAKIPLRQMETAGFGDGSAVAETLLQLEKTARDLNPQANLGEAGGFVSSLLEKIPRFGDRMSKYIRKFQSSEALMRTMAEALMAHIDRLVRDNIAVEQEKKRAYETLVGLRQFIYAADRLDRRLEEVLPALSIQEPERAKAIREHALLEVRQKRIMLRKSLGVFMMGFMVFDNVLRNNRDLIRVLETARHNTMAMISIGFAAAVALSNQKKALDFQTSIDQATDQLMDSVAGINKTQTTQVQKKLIESSVSIRTLQKALETVVATAETASRFRIEALGTMEFNIQILQRTIDDANKTVEQIAARDAGILAAGLEVPRSSTGAVSL